jgi:hypothetical protein
MSYEVHGFDEQVQYNCSPRYAPLSATFRRPSSQISVVHMQAPNYSEILTQWVQVLKQ